MPLNVDVEPITIPPIVDSLDEILSQYDVSIQSIPTSIRTARHIIKKFRKRTEPWLLIITPACADVHNVYLDDEPQEDIENTVRLIAIVKSSMTHDPLKKINEKFFRNELPPITLSKNSVLLKPLYLELLTTIDPYEIPRYDPLIMKTIRQMSDLTPTLPIILEVLRSNRSLIRTNLKE